MLCATLHGVPPGFLVALPARTLLETCFLTCLGLALSSGLSAQARDTYLIDTIVGLQCPMRRFHYCHATPPLSAVTRPAAPWTSQASRSCREWLCLVDGLGVPLLERGGSPCTRPRWEREKTDSPTAVMGKPRIVFDKAAVPRRCQILFQ